MGKSYVLFVLLSNIHKFHFSLFFFFGGPDFFYPPLTYFVYYDTSSSKPLETGHDDEGFIS
jgi:hypothetical protein